MTDNQQTYVLELGGKRYEVSVAEIEALHAAMMAGPGDSATAKVFDAFADSDLIEIGDPKPVEPAGPSDPT